MALAFLHGQGGASGGSGSHLALTQIFSNTQNDQTITPTHDGARYLMVNGSQVAEETFDGTFCKVGSNRFSAYDNFGVWSCTALLCVVKNGATYDLTKLDGTVVESGLTSFKVQSNDYQFIAAVWLDII